MSASHPHLSVMLTCRDTAESARFYRDVLGFEMAEAWPSAERPMWANMVLDGQSIMVGQAMDPENLEADCGHATPEELEIWKRAATQFREHPAGVGIQIYVQVGDVDAYHATIRDRGAEPLSAPKTQFYGIREFHLEDPDGYRLVFHTPVAMESCQSCGMPLTDAKPGQMHCAHCVDETGALRPYEQIFEGTVTGYFMGVQKMERAQAEAAATEHLAKMPAWAGRS